MSEKELLEKEGLTGIVLEQYQTVSKYSGREWGVYTKDDLLEVLGQTVKQDNTNKLIVFFCQLLAYTENDQLNVSFIAPSSSGKSYLALEIANLFPSEDIIDLGYASPASFFHSRAAFDKERKGYVVDLERRIVIFLDMPHPQLLERLRPVLSHDKKEVHIKITDKQKGGLSTKDIFIIGHASVIFCSASSMWDEQENTRFLILSPETSQEKIREALFEIARKEADYRAYCDALDQDPKRKNLRERIFAIRHARIKQINLHDRDKFLAMFSERNQVLKPRHTRDIKRIACITKGFALLNLWHRGYRQETRTIETTDEDYEQAFAIWDQIAISQDFGLPPHLLNFYQEIIVAAYIEHDKTGLTRQDIMKKHFEVYGRHVPDFKLRKEYLPMLENSGLISQEQDKNDRRVLRIYPLVLSTVLTQEQPARILDPGNNQEELI